MRIRPVATVVALASVALGLVALPVSQATTTVALAAVGPRCPWVTSPAGQSDAELADEVVGRMTLAQELDVVTLLSTKAYENSTTAVPALCIPALTLQDGPDGLAYGDSGVTQFPAAIALAASFDPSLAYEEGRAIGEQARAQGVDAVQGPYLNLARVPQAGRVFEGYGEDPTLISAMGVADVEGIQAAGVLADAKDLGIYTQESNRDFLDQVVSERALQELYLAPFRAVVEKAGVASIMCGFGKVNGVGTCQDAAVLGDVRSWGFAGFVRDDINAAPDGPAALAAGLDLFKPSPWAGGSAAPIDATERAEIGAAARTVLAEMFRFELIQKPRTGRTSSAVQTPAEQATALSVAEHGAVLLKDKAGALPLSSGVSSIAVVGAGANASPITSGGGSSHVAISTIATPLTAIERHWPKARVTIAPGEPSASPATEIPSADVSPPLPVPPPSPAHPVYHTGSPPTGSWRTWTGVLRAPVTGLYRLSVLSHGDTELAIGGRRLLDDPGTHGPTMIQLAHSFVAGRRYAVSMRWFDYDGNVPSLGWQDVTPMIEAAATAASHASVALVFVGNQSTEGADSPSLGLAGVQDALVEAVARANPDTIVMLDTGGAVLMPWLSSVRAVLEAWYPGQVDGSAIAALLSGAVDPSGRLPITFPRSSAATSVASPALWPGVGGTVNLGAAGGGGLDVGYRYYQAHDVKVLFPFGYGLSYTNFSLASLRVAPAAGANGGYSASVAVTDTGTRAGTDVVEAYLHYPVAAGEPPRGLVAFATVSLRPGQTKDVRLQLAQSAFETWGAHGLATVPGRYEIEVGSSSANLPLGAGLILH
ncbi:MAG: Beta-glucosidase [Acidimicrobiaceae bacterium]|nr:Beta-glucosidase [Acidimicrobiaceae bacterium]